jgi:hypothetical protein
MKIPATGEARREYFRRIGRKGGKIGGKRSLETLTQAARTARAFKGGQATRKVDRAHLAAMRKAGMTGRAIAAELGVSPATVWRNLAAMRRKRSADAAIATIPFPVCVEVVRIDREEGLSARRHPSATP